MKKVRLCAWFAVLCLLAASLTGCFGAKTDRDGTKGLQYEAVAGGYQVVGYSGTEPRVIVPATYQDKPVVAIGAGAFKDCIHLKSIIIPDSVTDIGLMAFFGCTDLARIVIPDGVATIGISAFHSCTALSDVTIGAGVTSIGFLAFSDCAALSSITVAEGNRTYYSKGNCLIETATGTLLVGCKTSVIPSQVTGIGDYAFRGCAGLAGIVIPEGVANIGRGVFFGCEGLSDITVAEGNGTYHSKGNCVIRTANHSLIAGCKTSVIPGGVTSIASYAFEGCTGLERIAIPDSIISIGSRAFSGCTELSAIMVAEGNRVYHSKGNCLIETATGTLVAGCKSSVIPSGVTTIGAYAFDCAGIAEIAVPEGVQSIGDGAFSDCESLCTVTLPDSVTRIGERAFSGCTKLESILLPGRVGSIGGETFSGCASLENMTVDVENRVYHSKGNCLIETATGTLVAGCKASVIPSYVTAIGSAAFSGCTGLSEIVIPDSVKRIGRNAFLNCTGLSDVTIGAGVTAVEDYAFAVCPALTEITIPDGVSFIGRGGFYGCPALSSVTFADTNAGWKTDSHLLSVTDAAQNALYLKETYCNDSWTRQ